MLLRRLAQLYLGLCLYGFSSGLMLLSGLGNNPWNVFHQGLSIQTGIGTGYWTDIVGVLLLLLWIPLRQWPGLGTVSNAVVIGLALEATITHLGAPHAPALRLTLLVGGIVLNGVATGAYIGARFGPGPRDGLMTGLHALTGRSLRAVRTGIELTVLTAGVLLGGTFGAGTIAYALAIGPLAQFFVPRLTVPERRKAYDNAPTWRRNGAASSPRPVADSTIGIVSRRRPHTWTLAPSQSRISATSPDSSAPSREPSSASSASHSCAAIRQPSA
jgi:uncharacterized membrane protein YczE